MSLTVSVVIPTRNEHAEAALAPVLEKCRAHADEILVVGEATDRAREIAGRHGARVEAEDSAGPGAALRRGIQLATGHIVVFLDADGAHDPGDIPKLVAPIAAGQADQCIASRLRGGSDETCATLPQLVRMMGGQIATLAINHRFGVRLSDSLNGFRAFLTSALRRLPLREDGPAIRQELTIQSIRHGLRVMEIPIHEYARAAAGAETSVWREAPRHVFSCLKSLIRN
jgi:glycosyltransferase involved in cell wall biosynthesis